MLLKRVIYAVNQAESGARQQQIFSIDSGALLKNSNVCRNEYIKPPFKRQTRL